MVGHPSAETTQKAVQFELSFRIVQLIERFARTNRDTIEYQVTFVDPTTWAAPWTAALSLSSPW